MHVKGLLKLLVLGGLAILLLIALVSISGITRQRQQRQCEVKRKIASSYAGQQRIVGPIITLEYREFWNRRTYDSEENRWYEKEICALRTTQFYPQDLSYTGDLQVQERYRGIFKAHVFQNNGSITGTVRIPEETSLHTENDSRIEIVSARASLCISDPRGISQLPEFQWNQNPAQIIQGSALSSHREGIHALIPADRSMLGKTVPFSFNLHLHGMEQFQLVPLGADNQIQLHSAWPHPSFTGDFLATTRSVSDSGFTAEWNVNGLACSAQQDLNAGSFNQLQCLGVQLIDPVNPYPMTDRALKYGFLFIFLTFASFFLFELIRQLQIHPIQYGFVGLAQALFFLLLLSLSEHLRFGPSYLLASAATIAVISTYLCSVLKGFKRGALFGGMLSFLYAALYGLLQSEDHALVAGSLLLFGLLALVMTLTRNVDWYALSKKSEGKK